jgi:murein L,D-transpeptidase YcbB/YkuD
VQGHTRKVERRNVEAGYHLEKQVGPGGLMMVYPGCLHPGNYIAHEMRNGKMKWTDRCTQLRLTVSGIPRDMLLWLTVWSITIACNSRSVNNQPAASAAMNALELLLDSVACESETSLLIPLSSRDFYSSTGYQLAWSKNGRPLPAADTMVRILRTPAYYGLFRNDYHRAEIDTLLRNKDNPFAPSRLDLLLTDSFLAMAFHLKSGQLNHPGRHDPSVYAALRKSIATNDIRQTLEKYEPVNREYRLLKQYLRSVLNNPDPAFVGGNKQTIMRYLFANMERWRWEREAWTDRYILINIPSYSITVVNNGEVVLRSRAIVGKPDTPTPVLSSALECITVYPTWTVPRSIAIEEILPKIQSDSSYLSRQRFDVLATGGRIVDASGIDWKKYNRNNLEFSFRQRAGTNNTLGVLRFKFDNPYAVYLHDTNARYLFSREFRALSHGCIRIENPVQLAYYLAGSDSTGALKEELDDYLERGISSEVMLSHPMPIYIRYFTATQDGDNISFHPDVYKQDERLLAEQADSSEQSPNLSLAPQTRKPDLNQVTGRW